MSAAVVNNNLLDMSQKFVQKTPMYLPCLGGKLLKDTITIINIQRRVGGGAENRSGLGRV